MTSTERDLPEDVRKIASDAVNVLTADRILWMASVPADRVAAREAIAKAIMADRLTRSAAGMGEPVAVKECIALSLDGLPPVQVENLHYFKNDAPAPFDAPAIKAMARELLAYRTIHRTPLYAAPARYDKLQEVLNVVRSLSALAP